MMDCRRAGRGARLVYWVVMERPRVDVVVPFAGPAGALRDLRARLEALALGQGDSLTVVDNRLTGPDAEGGDVTVVRATAWASPGYARNQGAVRGSAEWILFLDADVLAPPDLIDRYFDPEPDPGAGILAGGVTEEPPRTGELDGPAARYARMREAMSQANTMAHGRWAFVQTVNCAVRRSAFEEVEGFRDDARAGEDADLTYRLAAAGWALEHREHAQVLHRSRPTVRGLLAQRACHGAGAAWLNRTYPGSFPPWGRVGLIWWGSRRAVGGGLGALARRDREGALTAVLDGLHLWAFEIGRLRSNRPRSSAGRGGTE